MIYNDENRKPKIVGDFLYLRCLRCGEWKLSNAFGKRLRNKWRLQKDNNCLDCMKVARKKEPAKSIRSIGVSK